MVVFEWVEWLKEYLGQRYGVDEQEGVTVAELGGQFEENHIEDHTGMVEEEEDKPVADISTSGLAE
ncbi:hypothetical protein M427DRAFT_54702 [Gonapodya prolifera JEL478]|uniref:Uncharacterized protein n=1 Tax=Gonapodya prolifera (strain JEL478) TaxID=1344416 RepID=A0A139AKX1_GONPJ|nr:hypothetical protein M427DRAFT_54702 [Gonapodya prolifera JEL478]|eukprot:KXS17427.1 hypothetical protein M427DRAFT_54702 [Gonapodya prolifera JEL478]